MKNSMKVLATVCILGTLFMSCSKDQSNGITIIHPQVFAGYATVVNGVNVPISTASPRPLDSSSVGNSYKSAINVEINNTDSVTSGDFVWFKVNTTTGVFLNALDTTHINGDIKHITSTVVLPATTGVNIYSENNLSINQYYGSISIPVGSHVLPKGMYGFIGTLKTAKGGITVLPSLLIQIN